MKFANEQKDNVSATMNKKIAFSGDVSQVDNWLVTHRDKDGNIKDEFTFSNRIVNEGLDYALGTALTGEVQQTTWYIGLISGSPTVDATDTISEHPGWTEVTDYSEEGRQEWVSGSVADQSVNNSGSPAVFTFSEDGVEVGGAMLIADDTKGGTTGILFAAGAFEKGNKTFDIDDNIEVTAQFSNSYGA